MTSIFDGMAGVLNGIFGAPVMISPGGGPAVEVRGVLRDEPVEQEGQDGETVVSILPSLKLQLADAQGLVRGDLVEAADGRRFRVTHPVPGTSPAADRFTKFVLRKD